MKLPGIIGLGAFGPQQRATRTRSSGGFSVPGEGQAGGEAVAGAAGGPGALGGVAMPSLLAMQEAESEPVEDREARRHGSAMLKTLTALQQALLGGKDTGALQTLAAQMRSAPSPSDPRLVAVQRALLQRVAVELARGRYALERATGKDPV